MKINGVDLKSWLTGIMVCVTIISGVLFYIYAEATGSRVRDSEIKSYVFVEDTKLREKINQGQLNQMSLLYQIKEKLVVVQGDIECIKKNGE